MEAAARPTSPGWLIGPALHEEMLWLRAPRLPGMLLPVVGGTVFTTLVVIWFTSAFWFFDNFGFPNF